MKSEKQKAKDKAWKSFSRYIRTRDCIETTGTPDRGICITCGNVFDFKKLQAGHFIGGRSNSVLFDEEIVYAQCYGCNCGQSGKYVDYTLIMLKKHGVEWIDNKLRQKHHTLKYSLQDYIDIKKLYEDKTKELLEGL